MHGKFKYNTQVKALAIYLSNPNDGKTSGGI